MITRNAVLALALALMVTGTAQAQDPDAVWHENFAASQAASQASGKPMLVNFGGPGCGPCEKMKTETLADETVAATIAAKFEAAHVDAAQEPEIATRYLVNQFPTIKFMDSEGVVVHDHRGFVTAEAFLSVLETALETYTILVSTRAMAAEAGEDTPAETSAEIARGFFSVKQYESAASWARRALETLPADAADLRANASFVLGVSLAESGEARAAIEHLLAALELQPEAEWVWQARLNLGYAYLQTDQREQGGELLREVAAAEEADAEFRREALVLLRWVGLDVP